MTWSFYNPETGEISKRTFSGSERRLVANTPPGMIAIEGVLDYRTQRIDLETKQPIQHQPGVEALAVERRNTHARHLLREIDFSMVRALAQLADDPLDAKARARLAELKARAEVVRADVAPTEEELSVAVRLERL